MVAGYAGAGKDTSVQSLVKNHGYIHEHFAYPLKQAVRILNPWIRTPGVKTTTSTISYEFSKLEDLIEKFGLEYVKAIPEVREYYQKMGTDVGRDLFREDFWVNLKRQRLEEIFENDPDAKVAVTDTRFHNEIELCNDYGGMSVWINNKNITKINNHVSESGVVKDLCQFELNNNGTPELLQEQMEVLEHNFFDLSGEMHFWTP